jgi:hypothetical protein
MVCKDDLDQLDPYRLPARQTERINLDFVRPDLPLTGFQELDTLFLLTEDGINILTEDDDPIAVEFLDGVVLLGVNPDDALGTEGDDILGGEGL